MTRYSSDQYKENKATTIANNIYIYWPLNLPIVIIIIIIISLLFAIIYLLQIKNQEILSAPFSHLSS